MNDNKPFEDSKNNLSTKHIIIYAIVSLSFLITLAFVGFVLVFAYLLVVQPSQDSGMAKKSYMTFAKNLGSEYRLLKYDSSSSYGQEVHNVRLSFKVSKPKSDASLNDDVIKALESSGCDRTEDNSQYPSTGGNGEGTYSYGNKKYFILSPPKSHMNCDVEHIYVNKNLEVHSMYSNIDLTDSKDQQYSDGIRFKTIPDNTLYTNDITITFFGF